MRSADPRDPVPTGVHRHLLEFLERSPDAVVVTDGSGRVAYRNAAARERLGTRRSALRPATSDLFPPAALEVYVERIHPAVVRGDVWSGSVPVLLAGGDVAEMWATVVGEAGPADDVRWLVISARDLTEWCHVREALNQEATRDPLTGLANRTLLLDRLEIALARTRRTGGLVAVLFVDVDDLKVVNDTFGHHAGDVVLATTAQRLRDAVRAIDTVARVGGDEFVVLLDGVEDAEEARSLATRVHAVLEGSAMEVGTDTAVNVSSSIGLAVGDATADGEQLLRRADARMYEVKAARRPPRRVAGPTSHAVVPAVTSHDVAVALTQRMIVPYHQPVVTAGTGDLVALHALARWITPEAEPVPAAEFVGIVDGTAVGFSLDLAMIRHALGDLASWPELSHVRVEVPVAPHFLRHRGVERFVHEVLTRSSLPASRLALSLPEHLLVARDAAVTRAWSALHEAGIALVATLDRAEPAALERLDSRTFHEVRVPVAREPLAPIVEHAHRRGLVVRAVGVETEQQRDHASGLGCDALEGHLLGRARAVPARTAPRPSR